METIHHRMLVNSLFQTLHPALSAMIGRLRDQGPGGLISELTFQEFEVLVEYLRGSNRSGINAASEPGT